MTLDGYRILRGQLMEELASQRAMERRVHHNPGDIGTEMNRAMNLGFEVGVQGPSYLRLTGSNGQKAQKSVQVEIVAAQNDSVVFILQDRGEAICELVKGSHVFRICHAIPI